MMMMMMLEVRTTTHKWLLAGSQRKMCKRNALSSESDAARRLRQNSWCPKVKKSLICVKGLVLG